MALSSQAVPIVLDMKGIRKKQERLREGQKVPISTIHLATREVGAETGSRGTGVRHEFMQYIANNASFSTDVSGSPGSSLSSQEIPDGLAKNVQTRLKQLFSPTTKNRPITSGRGIDIFHGVSAEELRTILDQIARHNLDCESHAMPYLQPSLFEEDLAPPTQRKSRLERANRMLLGRDWLQSDSQREAAVQLLVKLTAQDIAVGVKVVARGVYTGYRRDNLLESTDGIKYSGKRSAFPAIQLVGVDGVITEKVRRHLCSAGDWLYRAQDSSFSVHGRVTSVTALGASWQTFPLQLWRVASRKELEELFGGENADEAAKRSEFASLLSQWLRGEEESHGAHQEKDSETAQKGGYIGDRSHWWVCVNMSTVYEGALCGSPAGDTSGKKRLYTEVIFFARDVVGGTERNDLDDVSNPALQWLTVQYDHEEGRKAITRLTNFRIRRVSDASRVRQGRSELLSRLLASTLRHTARDENFRMTTCGAVQMEELLQSQRFNAGTSFWKSMSANLGAGWRGSLWRQVKLTAAELFWAVHLSEKQRFSVDQFSDHPGKWWIRAQQGHTIKEVDEGRLLYEVELNKHVLAFPPLMLDANNNRAQLSDGLPVESSGSPSDASTDDAGTVSTIDEVFQSKKGIPRVSQSNEKSQFQRAIWRIRGMGEGVFHCTRKTKLPDILKFGLKTMGRNHIHFTTTSALKSDEPAFNFHDKKEYVSKMRSPCDAHVEIDLRKCLEAGMSFFVSGNGVVLSSGLKGIGIPPEYFIDVVYTENESNEE